MERDQDYEQLGRVWYRDIPDKFLCRCNNVDLDLTLIRRNLHGLLDQATTSPREISFVQLYEAGALEIICKSFGKLLDESPLEEKVQNFIEENAVVLHQFSPLRIFFKKRILTRYVTDVALVTPKKELVLIELERPGLRIMKKDGGVAADLQHAMDQVRNWLHECDEHRLAVLDTLDLQKKEVGSIRGVVIAGRNEGYDAEKLRKLKATDFGRIVFFTYDDLLKSVAGLSTTVGSL